MTGRKTGCNRSRPVFFGFSIFRQTSQLATEKIQNLCNRNRWSGLLQLGSVRFRSFFQSSELDLWTLCTDKWKIVFDCVFRLKTAPLNWQFIKPARWFKVEQQLVGPPAKWTSPAWRHSIWYSQVQLLRGNESQSVAPPRRTRRAFSHWYPSVDVKTDVWLSL